MQLHLLTQKIENQDENLFCLFVSWTPTVSRVFRVKYDPLFWKISMDLFVAFLYHGHFLKQCPTKVHNQELVDYVDYYVKNAVERNAELVGEYPSCFSDRWEE